MQKTCWLWAPTTLKTVHESVIFSYLTMNITVIILFFCKKNTPNLIKLFLSYVAKPRVGPINREHNNFKWGNIFAGVFTLVLSLWFQNLFSFLDWNSILLFSLFKFRNDQAGDCAINLFLGRKTSSEGSRCLCFTTFCLCQWCYCYE